MNRSIIEESLEEKISKIEILSKTQQNFEELKGQLKEENNDMNYNQEEEGKELKMKQKSSEE